MSEFDETFVLDCYKGKGMDSSIPRGPRRNGAKAEKRGIQRKGDAMAATVNRAKPSAKELLTIFEGHIADRTLALYAKIF